ncbi:hypothetical protein DRJ19_05345 [Candidatus Woesearchaeota archaeon]|nr:MAG: hypothetical protein DRJ19_05345 [Candidatus Woesearchaeota archaeon]
MKNIILKELTMETLKYYFNFPYKIVLSKNSGYFASRIYDESNNLCSLAIDTASDLLSSLIIAITSLALILYFSWKMTCIFVVIIPVIYMLARKFGTKVSSFSEQEKEKEANLREKIITLVSSYRTVKLFNLYDISFKKVHNALDRFLNALYSKIKFTKLYGTLNDLFMSLMEFFVLIGLGIGVILGFLTIGGLFGYMQAFWRGVSGITSLIENFPRLMSLKGYLNRLKEFESFQEKEKSWEGKEIVLDKINYSFPERSVIKNFSLSIKGGEKILITGPNGSGKTTLLNIMCGFLEPEGHYKLTDLKNISAMIMPMEFIPGSLKDNVDFNVLSENNKRKFLTLIEKFGLDNKLEKTPFELSEGEKKKFCIIRTLLKQAEVYFFDEPLSNIDEGSKEDVMNVILSETKGKSLVVVMHGGEKFHACFDEIIRLR